MNPDDAHPSNQQDPQWDELVENFRQLDAAAPREPSAEERKAQLEKLFNTGPAAVRGPRDYEVDDTGEEFVPEAPAALGFSGLCPIPLGMKGHSWLTTGTSR